MNDNINPAYVLLGAVLVLAVLASIHFLGKKKKSQAPRLKAPPSDPSLIPDFEQNLAAAPSAKRFDPRGVASPMRTSLYGCITHFDTAPDELNRQAPFKLRFIRPLPASDGSNYVLAALHQPLTFRGEPVHFVVVGARFEGTQVSKGMNNFPINIAIVKDQSLVEDAHLDFSKVEYVAIGFCDEIAKQEMD
jgi:hypothetical protein